MLLPLLWCSMSTVVFASASVPMLPSIDAFYQPPFGYESLSPGTILRHRETPAPANINTTIAAAYQLLFRSTDSNGLPTAVVTSVFVPPNADNGKLLSVQNAYDSAAIDCAPSYQLHLPNSAIAERVVIQLALKAGLYVSVPDYEGWRASYTNGIESGQAVLDSLRAVSRSMSVTGLRTNARKVLAGASGGALGSEWALELQPFYAPELRIDGSLLTALTPNVTSVLETVENTTASGLIPLGLIGMAKQSLSLSQWLSQNLQPASTSQFFQANMLCGTEFQAQFGTQDIASTYFNRTGAYFDPEVTETLQKLGVMGLHGVPQSPIFSYKGTEDEVSPVADTDALMQKYCAEGASITYQRANASHIVSAAIGFLKGWSWVQDRLNGVDAPSGCKVSNVTVPNILAY